MLSTYVRKWNSLQVGMCFWIGSFVVSRFDCIGFVCNERFLQNHFCEKSTSKLETFLHRLLSENRVSTSSRNSLRLMSSSDLRFSLRNFETRMFGSSQKKTQNAKNCCCRWSVNWWTGNARLCKTSRSDLIQLVDHSTEDGQSKSANVVANIFAIVSRPMTKHLAL